MITYEIRQQVKSITNQWLELIDEYSEPAARIAKNKFDDLERDYPDEHFELVKVEHTEECLGFTKNRGVNQK